MAWWRRGLLEDLGSNGVGFSRFGMSRWEVRRQLAMVVLFVANSLLLAAVMYFFSLSLIQGQTQTQPLPQPFPQPGPSPNP